MASLRIYLSTGDSREIVIPLVKDGAAFSPAPETGSLIFTVKHCYDDEDEDAVFQKASGAGITLNGSDAAVAILRADTLEREPKEYYVEMLWQDSDSLLSQPVAAGKLILDRRLTREQTTSVPVVTTEDPLPLAQGPQGEPGDPTVILEQDNTFAGENTFQSFLNVNGVATFSNDVSFTANAAFFALTVGGQVQSGSNTGDETTATIKSKLGISTLSGTNTGDQDLSGLATTSALSSEAATRAAADTALTTALTGKMDVIRVKDYGAVGDARRVSNGVVSGTSVTSSGTNFTGYAGKYIRIEGAGTAGADHITTIATASNGSCTLTVTAPTAVGSNAVIYFGTNDTTAIQNAIEAARTSMVTHRVELGLGSYLCNLTVYENTQLIGSGGGLALTGLLSLAQQADRTATGTLLMPAVATSPVIYGAGPVGLVVQDLKIQGSDSKRGTAIQIGDPSPAVDTFTANGILTERISIVGFNKGLSMARTADTVHRMNFIARCNYGFWLSEDMPGSNGISDGAVFESCGGDTVGTYFFLNGSKNIVISSGDFNFISGNLVELADHAGLTVTAVNVEYCTGDLFKVTDSYLDVGVVKVLGGDGALVAQYGTTDSGINIRNAFVTGTTLSSLGYYVAYRTTTNAGVPAKLPPGMAVVRYTSTAWSTVNETIPTDWLYSPKRERYNRASLREHFLRANSSPFGNLGWVVTAIGGGYAAWSPSNWPYGVIGLGSTSSGTGNSYRFATENPIFVFQSTDRWEMRWTLQDGANSAAIDRFGLYTKDASPTIKPTNGVGFRSDKSGTPDTTIKLEVITSGTSVVVDTGVATTALSSVSEFIIRKTDYGLSAVILNGNGVPRAPEVSTTTSLPQVYAVPSMHLGVASTAYIGMEFGGFSFEPINPSL